MKSYHVVSVSIGTGLLMLGTALIVVIGVAVSTVAMHSKPVVQPPTLRPQVGVLNEIESTINDLKYGPVNTNATKEIKNGLPLFDRIRANRQARICTPVVQQYCPPCPQVVVTNSTPYSLQVAPLVSVTVPTITQDIVTPTIEIEMPAITPPPKANDCPDGKCKPKQAEAIKTGAFICSNCRKSKVGDWHTEWKTDGTPVTFLCERCHTIMTEEQREKAYIGYLSRQSKTVGTTGLLHQEMSQ